MHRDFPELSNIISEIPQKKLSCIDCCRDRRPTSPAAFPRRQRGPSLDRSTSWVLLTLFWAKIVNIAFAMLIFCNPYSFFTEDTIEFSRPFSARTILALFPKRIKKLVFSTKKYFSAALNIRFSASSTISDDFGSKKRQHCLFGRFVCLIRLRSQ